jgi:hypothetical protein
LQGFRSLPVRCKVFVFGLQAGSNPTLSANSNRINQL